MKKRQTAPKKQENKPATLGDLINDDLMKQLKETKQQLQAAEERKKETEEEKKREERRLKEKNKSFEELLNENSLNWQDYK